MTVTLPEGRPLNLRELAQQIGPRTIMAIVGLPRRIQYLNESTVTMPCGSGHHVEVMLADDDTYTVRRVYRRGGKRFVHGEQAGVYCDQISDVAYAASCYVNVPFGEGSAQ